MAKELPRVSFLDFYRTTTLPNSFWLIRCYEVTFVKMYNKPLLQVSETDFGTNKIDEIFLFKVNLKSNSDVMRINQVICKLLTLSQSLQSNSQQIAAVRYIATLTTF